jgi:predicted Zn finger-like uncharacterized protein
MILTCPECATRYFIDGGVIGFTGRTVRCTACRASWQAYPEDDPIELSVDDTAEPEAAPDEPSAEAPTEDAPPLAELPADKLPGAFRAKAEERRRMREAAAQGAVWAALVAGVAMVLGAVVVFRADIVRSWPRTAGAFAAIGLPVNTIGLTIEDVQAQPGLEDGRAAVIVTGALRNIESHPVTAPPLRINLLNKAGKAVQGKIASAADPKIPPGETRHFTITLRDPPSSATDVEVVFEEPKPAVAVKAAKAPPAEPTLRGPPPPPRPEPIEARPLTPADTLALENDAAAAHE